MRVNVLSITPYVQTKLLADKGKCSSQLKPRAGLRRKTTWLFLSIGKIKEGAQVSGRKMDELITALMRRGRGTGMPFHHPALTAAGQRQTGRLQQPLKQGSLPLLSALGQGPAAAAIWAIIPARRRRREDELERNPRAAVLSSALWFLSCETIITFPSTSSEGSKCFIFISGDDAFHTESQHCLGSSADLQRREALYEPLSSPAGNQLLSRAAAAGTSLSAVCGHHVFPWTFLFGWHH